MQSWQLSKRHKQTLLAAVILTLATGFLSVSVHAQTPQNTLGRILLQVEEHGEAWYVDPISQERYYLRDGASAYEALRTFGLGITNNDIEKIPIGVVERSSAPDADNDGVEDKLEEALGTNLFASDTDNDGFSDLTEIQSGFSPTGPGSLPIEHGFSDGISGRILLQVESRGEAWYVHPEDGKRYYMANGDAAYENMRFLSLGITNTDLDPIPIRSDSPSPSESVAANPVPEPDPEPEPTPEPEPEPEPIAVQPIPIHQENANYLIVTANELYDSALQLRDYRENDGYTVAVMPVSFIAGVDNPTASQIDWWIEAYQNAFPLVEFVALLGDEATIPLHTFLRGNTESGLDKSGLELFTDTPYAINGDVEAGNTDFDLVLGRISVETNEEFTTYMNKIQEFESNFSKRNKIVFFGYEIELNAYVDRDSGHASDAGFESSSLIFPTEDELFDALNGDDLAMVMFYGHGTWSNNWTLNVYNLDRLDNPGEPILYFSGGCGFGTDSGEAESLSTELLLSKNGAAASVGANEDGGYGYNYEMIPGFFEAIKNGVPTMGEAMNESMTHAYLAGVENEVPLWSLDFLHRMSFEGDPALDIRR